MQTNENSSHQVFRITPTPGKIYATASYTHKTKEGYYYTTHPLETVGTFSHITRSGWGDVGRVFAHFLLDGFPKIVEFNYEGTTSFVEIEENAFYLFTPLKI
jgi:hypothetical protein